MHAESIWIWISINSRTAWNKNVMFGGGLLLFMQFCQKTRRINDWLVLQHSIRTRSDCIISWQVMSGLDALVCSHVKLLWRLRVCLLCLSSFLTSYSGSCYNITCPVIIHWAISYKYLFSLRRPGRHKRKKGQITRENILWPEFLSKLVFYFCS